MMKSINKLVLFTLFLLLTHNSLAQTNCSVASVLKIKNDTHSTLKKKSQDIKGFVRQCRQYQRVAYAILADIYFSVQDFKHARKYFSKVYQSKTGVEPINTDEMLAKYALTLHFLNRQPSKSHEIFLELRDKYNDNLPDKLKQLYTTYRISLSKQTIPQELLLSALSSTKSYKNLVICPSINVTIQFDYNSAEIRSANDKQIWEIHEALMAPALAQMNYHYELVGHTDIRGDADYNQQLSVDRAEAVKKALVNLEPGLYQKLSAFGKGESEPELEGDSEDIHQVNRRVEIRVACDI